MLHLFTCNMRIMPHLAELLFEKRTKKMIVLTDPQSVGPCLSKILKEDVDLHGILDF